MTYRVFYSQGFQDDIREHVHYLECRRVSAETIERWYDVLFELVDGLSEMPGRCPVDERASERWGFEVHKLAHRKYLIHYRIDQSRRLVELLSLTHGARRP